jgi:MoCo/4Fe-4S cofactor protein with predicted Tat translocation signal
MSDHPLDLAAIRDALSRAQGKLYWRSLEELAASERFQEFLQREFPRQAAVWDSGLSRRRFLQVMGASLALAGLSGCLSQPVEKIVPYVKAPEEVVPGQPLFFATAVALGGFAAGVLVESHMGRPTKIEGNPDHPASLGAADALTQAAILSLYDPDRSQTVTQGGQPSTWDAFVAALGAELAKQAASRGAGLRVLTETVTSPTLAAQLQALLAAYPAARWHQYEGVHRDHAIEGARLAFGEPVGVHYRLDQADVILSLDADFLNAGPGHVRYAHDFAARRRVADGATAMNRLYVVESTPGVTGAIADHRWPVRSSQVEGVARALAAQLGVAGVPPQPRRRSLPTGWLLWRAICRPIAGGAWWWRATSSRRSSTRWRTPSTTPWATSAAPSSTPIRSRPRRSIRPNPCASWRRR